MSSNLTLGTSQLARLTLVYALLDRSTAVEVVHLDAAAALWEYAERSVRHLFGGSTGNRLAGWVLGHLRREGPPWPTRDELRRLNGQHDAARFADALSVLVGLGLVRFARGQGSARGCRRPAAVKIAHPRRPPALVGVEVGELVPARLHGLRSYVVDPRRGLDLLGALPEIEAKRIGFIGQSLGCAAGSIVSGIEPRIAAYALMACGGPCHRSCLVLLFDRRVLLRHRRGPRPLSGPPRRPQPRQLHRPRRGRGLLFQASKTDQIALESNVVALYDAAPQPKSLTWYERDDSALQDMGGHGLGCVTFGSCDPALPAFADHRSWLKEHV